MGPPEIGIQCNLERCLELAQIAGFGGIDIDIYETKTLVSENGAEFITNLFDARNMRIGGWIWFDHFGFSDDDDTFAQHLDVLPSLAQVAEAVGATRALSWILPYSDTLDYEENFALHVKRIRSAAKILNEHGQNLALEYIGPSTFRAGHKHEFVSTMAEALDLIAAVQSTNVGLILDSWHWYTSSGAVDDIKQLNREQVVYVHLSDAPADIPLDEQLDNVRRLPGSTGVINNVGFLAALKEIGYEGPVTAEPFSDEISALPDEQAARATATALAGQFERAGILTRPLVDDG